MDISGISFAVESHENILTFAQTSVYVKLLIIQPARMNNIYFNKMLNILSKHSM